MLSRNREAEYSANSRQSEKAIKCHIEASINVVWPKFVNVTDGGFYLEHLTLSNGVCLTSATTEATFKPLRVAVKGEFWDGELSYNYARVSTLSNEYDINSRGDLAFFFVTGAFCATNFRSAHQSLTSLGLQWAADGDSLKIDPIELVLKRGCLTDWAVGEHFAGC